MAVKMIKEWEKKVCPYRVDSRFQISRDENSSKKSVLRSESGSKLVINSTKTLQKNGYLREHSRQILLQNYLKLLGLKNS